MNARLVLTSLWLSLFVAGLAGAEPSLRTAAGATTSYPNSVDGLRQLVSDMIAAQKSGGEQALAPYLQSLVLPNSASWFGSVFGDENGRQFAAFYDAWGSSRDFQLSGDLERVNAEAQVDVLRFDKAGEPAATEKENYFLSLRQQPEPFYVVLFKSASRTSTRWGFFVYSDGAFRYVGALPDLRKLAKPAGPSAENQPAVPEIPKRIRMGGNVAQAHLIHQVPPVYPEEALKQHLEGTVVLHAVIAPDGAVQALDVVEGSPILAGAAEAAVKQWRYEPVLLNGSAVAVDTTITVKFQLRESSSTQLSAPAAPAPPIPSYPESTSGLTKMMKQMLELAKNGDDRTLSAYYQALVLPNPVSWFPSQFGDRLGTRFAQEYKGIERSMASIFSQSIQSATGLKFDAVEVRRFKDACDSNANEFEYPVLAAREGPMPLYEVRFVKDLSFRWIFSFAYVDGGFRYLGDLQIDAPKQIFSTSNSGADPVKTVQAPKLIKEVPPIFPSGIAQPRNAAQVKLWGVIGTDGSVRDLHVIEGTCAFAKAVMDAMKKWRFTPGMVNGQPHEMFYPFQYSFSPGR